MAIEDEDTELDTDGVTRASIKCVLVIVLWRISTNEPGNDIRNSCLQTFFYGEPIIWLSSPFNNFFLIILQRSNKVQICQMLTIWSFRVQNLNHMTFLHAGQSTSKKVIDHPSFPISNIQPAIRLGYSSIRLVLNYKSNYHCDIAIGSLFIVETLPL